jgi:hypothetical protein
MVALLAGCSNQPDRSWFFEPDDDVLVATMTPTWDTLNPGQSRQLSVSVARFNGSPTTETPTFTWWSQDSSIVAISSTGRITAKKSGRTAVFAQSTRATAFANITVRDVYDLDARGLPQFITSDYIDASMIERVSRFRAFVDVPYADAFETCRSMRHVFEPKAGLSWVNVAIRSPVTGTVESVVDEKLLGSQVHIIPDGFPAMRVILSHVKPRQFLYGDRVASGELIGTHIGNNTRSAIALRIDTPTGMRLVSYFDAMTDGVFSQYAARGIASRSALIIAKGERDANAIDCVGPTYLGTDPLPMWVSLQ